ncbi:hypothetical protein [Streptomyces sp. NPDC051211]|uniref:hypothetical protein n=1 Tax=Streptomyces sp. NPDC051211 TaxID=3154643 RepID=UPI00344B0EF3
MVRRIRGAGTAAAAAVATATLLAGCSGGQGTEGDGKGGAAANPLKAKPVAAINVPEAWDGAKGWDQVLPWVPENATSPVTVVPGGRAVALLNPETSGYSVQVRSATGGEPVWTSATWDLPLPLDGAKKAGEIPEVLGVEQEGQRFVVLAAHGTKGKDALHEGTEVVRLAVYPADAKGQGVKPLREIDVPVRADAGEVRVQTQGGRLLVAYGEDGDYPRFAASVDLVKGSATRYDAPYELLPQCETPHCSARVMAAGPAGPLVGLGGGFGVPGRWFSDSVRPGGVPAKSGLFATWNGDVYGAVGGRFLAQWENEGKNGNSAPPTWSVHDVDSGRLLARMECAYSEKPSGPNYRGWRDHTVVSSPSGRFLAAGPVAFDMERKQGVCLERDGNRKRIEVRAVRDDGTAYAEVDSDGPPVFAQLNLTTPATAPTVLPTGVEVPDHTGLDGAALFVARDESENLRISVRHNR